MKKKISKKKVVIGLLLIAAIILTIVFIVYSNNLPELKISKEKTSYGSEGYFTVSANNFKTEVAAFDITITFDPEVLEILEVSKGDLGVDLVSSKENIANSKGKITVMFVDYSGGEKPLKLNGDMFYVRYKVKKPKTSSLEFEKINIVDSESVIQNNVKEKNGVVVVE